VTVQAAAPPERPGAPAEPRTASKRSRVLFLMSDYLEAQVDGCPSRPPAAGAAIALAAAQHASAPHKPSCPLDAGRRQPV
jgi:hypothetical protein